MNGPDFQYDGLTAFAPITSAATDKKKGLMSAADKAKLDTLAATVNRLGMAYAVDIFNGTAIAAATWTDCGTAQSFTLGSASNWLAVEIKLGLIATATGATHLSARANFDSGGLVIPFGNGIVPAASGYGAVQGDTFYLPPGTLVAGSHTVKVQFYNT